MLTRLRSFAFYGATTGAVTAAVPWILRSAFQLPRAGAASPAELRFALALFFAGLVVGSVYWLVRRLLGGAGGDRTT